MGLFRLLFWIALILAIIWLWRRVARSKRQRSKRSRTLQTHTMVRCHFCRVHVPQDKALSHGNHWYCCNDHLEKSLTRDQ
ncbi:uncharacterized protein IQ22_02200 [Pseudomonas duriflava]|uniref:MYND finger n=1 Tax=Pseudomonas duriflava TaxID=459528 RepID=A0A562QC51_9PSED|nr:PP0621 family protein [Pseudomonas duriflava]TWI54337.1 uncharacterized protein IQ22_02200 [Pseudomonas duriflava]